MPELMEFINDDSDIRKKDINSCCISNLKEFVDKIKKKIMNNLNGKILILI
jgi:hypothetical protein